MRQKFFITCAVLTALVAGAFAQTATNTAATSATGTNSVTGTNAVVAPPPPNPWDASIAAGLTITRGNSKTLLAVGTFLADKKWNEKKNELSLGADATYGENDNKKNADSQHAFGQFNRLFTDRAFGYLRLEGWRDTVADIDYRLSISPGAGYYFIKETNTTLRAEIGPGYIYEQQKKGHDSYYTLRLADRFDHQINKNAKIWEAAEILPQVDKFQNYIVNAEIGIETVLTAKAGLRVIAQDSYHSEPASGREKNDFKLIASIRYKF
jgi:putative salt-induced outer membrane protein YdiY